MQVKDNMALVINELCSTFPKHLVEMTLILIDQFSLPAKLLPKWVLIYSDKVHLSPDPPASVSLSYDKTGIARLRVTGREEAI